MISEQLKGVAVGLRPWFVWGNVGGSAATGGGMMGGGSGVFVVFRGGLIQCFGACVSRAATPRIGRPAPRGWYPWLQICNAAGVNVDSVGIDGG